MRNNIFLLLFFITFATGCGGGSSGTAIGGSGGSSTFSGLVLSRSGQALSSTEVRIINTDDVATTDEAGAFDLSTNIGTGDIVLEVKSEEGGSASVTIPNPSTLDPTIDLSILFEPTRNLAELLDLTIRARIVRTCSQFFLNTRTIRQTSPITEDFECTVEAEFKSDGLPADDLIFELQHRSCNPDAPWEYSATGKTGTSGPGVGEINFNFKNDEKHCVYRIIGPFNNSTPPLSAQINTLRKEKFDN